VKLALLLLAAGLLLALAACGESDEDKAKSDVCDARDDIQANVKDLQNLTLGTATLDKIRSNLTAIQDDVKKIADAQGKLSESDKEQVQKANDAFKSKLQSLAGDVGRSLSLEDAAQQLKSAFADLATTYRETYAPVDCG
jgi:ABC-type Zn uptake system ZnuABC Zn-binding protein ZnuA